MVDFSATKVDFSATMDFSATIIFSDSAEVWKIAAKRAPFDSAARKPTPPILTAVSRAVIEAIARISQPLQFVF